MSNKLKGFVLGFLLATVITISITSIAAVSSNNGYYKDLKCYFNNLQITLDGNKINTDVSPFIYEGRTMVPVRHIAEAMALDVEFNREANTIELTTRPDVFEEGTAIKYGNTNGNLANGGIFAESDGWVYYTYDNGVPGLYKADKNFNNKLKLCDKEARYINVMNNYIFFISYREIYRCKKDGSELTCLDSIGTFSSLYCLNDMLFYTKYKDGSAADNVEDYEIYSMKADGSNKRKISNEFVRKNIVVYEGWIYYTKITNKGGQLSKIKLNGTSKTKICDGYVNNMNISNDCIYYSNSSDHQYLYKIKTDGSNNTKLNNESSTNINICGDLIFYEVRGSYYSDICKINISGDDRSIIEKQYRIESISILGESVFYHEYYFDTNLMEEINYMYKSPKELSDQVKLWEISQKVFEV